eukprot:4330352-Amphidinium_carterae.1
MHRLHGALLTTYTSSPISGFGYWEPLLETTSFVSQMYFPPWLAHPSQHWNPFESRLEKYIVFWGLKMGCSDSEV